MEEPVGFFWHARRGQIYPELARLERAGYVSHTVVEQHDRPDKKVYAVTTDGLAALRAWAAAPIPVPPERDAFMLQVYSLWLVDPADAVALIRQHERRHSEQLERYEAIQAEMERDWPSSERRPDRPKFAAYATLMRGVEYERGYIAWCRWMIRALERAPNPEVPDADPG